MRKLPTNISLKSGYVVVQWWNCKLFSYINRRREAREQGTAGSAARGNHLVAFCHDGGGRECVFSAWGIIFHTKTSPCVQPWVHPALHQGIQHCQALGHHMPCNFKKLISLSTERICYINEYHWHSEVAVNVLLVMQWRTQTENKQFKGIVWEHDVDVKIQ